MAHGGVSGPLAIVRVLAYWALHRTGSCPTGVGEWWITKTLS